MKKISIFIPILLCMLLVRTVHAITVIEYTGTPTAKSNEGAGYEPDKATDNNANTFWYSQAPTVVQWIQIDFGASVTHIINNYTLQSRNTGYDAQYVPVHLSIERSNDLVVWTTVDNKTLGYPLGQGQIGIYSQAQGNISGSIGASRYYRLIDLGGNATQLAEIHLYCDAPPAATVTQYTGTPAVGSIAGADYTGNQAIDNNLATFWYSNVNGANDWLQIDFGVGTTHTINNITLTNRNDAGHTNYDPSDWYIEGSLDNTTPWTLLDKQAGVTGWGQGITKEYNSFTESGNTSAFRFIRYRGKAYSLYNQIAEFHLYYNAPTGAAPVASFTSTNISVATNSTSRGWEGVAPFQMVFNSTSTNTPTSFVYNATNVTGNNVPFGMNETAATLANIAYTFSVVGNYSIQLNATNAYGSSLSAQTTFVNVSSPPPTAPVSSFSLNKTSGSSPLAVQINDTSTYTTEKIDSWNLSIDHLGENWFNTTTPTSKEYTFTQVGGHSINLTVYNFSYGLSSFSTQNITCNQSVNADFVGAPTAGYPPTLVSFVDYSTGYGLFSWNWSFGDGILSTLRNPSHTYTSTGSYNVSLTVQGTDGNNAKTATNYINMLVPPVASFSSNVQTAANPATIQFYDTTISNETKTAWYWMFGDAFTSTSQNASHTYVTNGAYTVNFSVSTAYGTFWSNKTDYITVTVPAPTSEWCGIQYLYFNDTLSDIPGYQSLLNIASTQTEIDENITITSASGIVPIDSYLSVSGYPGAVILSAGLRTFNVWTYVSSASSESYLIYNESIRHADGSITPIFNMTSQDIDSTSIIQLVTPFTDLESTTFNTTDRLLINISAVTTRVAPTTIHFINGGNAHGSYLETALFICPAVSTQLPLTAFKQNITQGYSPLAVQFYDTSSYGLTRFWSFGDGSNSTEVNPLHTYTGAGQYSVTLIEANLYGTNIKTTANLINVLSPVAQYQNQSIVITNPYEVYYIWKRIA